MHHFTHATSGIAREVVRLRYHNITHDDMLNGDGLRVVLWVAGCEHHCIGCQNPITWDVNGGKRYTLYESLEIEDYLTKDYCAGITYSGGDPLHPANVEGVTVIAKEIKTCFPDKTQWLYTGYLWEEVKDLPVMRYLDVVVDGRFVQELADSQYEWAGSTNQRVIDVKKSLKTGSVILKGDCFGTS